MALAVVCAFIDDIYTIADLIAIATTVILFARNFNRMLYQHADTKVKK